MNLSHSPTLSIAGPLRTPPKAAGAILHRSSDENASDSFNALYDTQTASIDDANQEIDNDINVLEGDYKNRNDSLTTQEDASNAANTQLSTEQNQDPSVVNELTLRDNMDENPALAGHELASEDQTFETELLHGISVALPANSPQTRVGEKFPLGGKKLPMNNDRAEQEALLTKPTAESELGDVPARADTGIAIRGRGDVSERGERLRQDQVVDLNATRSDPSMNKHRLEMAQPKVLSEPLTEGLSLLTSKPLQDPTSVLTAGNNSPTNLAAIVSQVDTVAAQKLILAADAAVNTDINASARSGSFDRSTALGEKIHWMHNANISTAELQLHPTELGTIEIKIVTEDQQARVSFITSSATARDVIEESLPKLRELLADSGLALGQSDISQKESRDQPTRKDQQVLQESLHIEREMEREFAASSHSPRIGQVDHYV